MAEAVVIGSGIIGLTSAIRLAEAGFDTRILTAALPQFTPDGFANMCSDAAAAVWTVYKAYPEHLTTAWSYIALDVFISQYDLDCGVSPLVMTEVSAIQVNIPDWFHKVGYKVVNEMGFASAVQVEVPLIEPPKYLPYLLERFKQLGGTTTVQTVVSLDELVAPGRLIVNCTGMGARELVNDDRLTPIRGQVAVVSQLEAQLDEGFLCDDDLDHPVYIFPRSNDIVIGGSADHDESKAVWDDLKVQMMEYAIKLKPELAQATHLRDVVGLRPGRNEVRLELEELADNCAVIHNYGHGGAGYTLCWGCAAQVVGLAQNFTTASK